MLTTAVAQDSMWDQAETSLNEYREKVNEGLSSAFINNYTALAQTADSLIAAAIISGNSGIVSTLEEALSEYRSIKQAAEDARIDITICVNNFEQLIVDVRRENSVGLNECVQNLIDPILTYISGASTGLAERYLGDVYQNEKLILNCGPLDDDCLSNPVYVLVQANARVQGEIANDLARDVGQFGMYESQLNACTTKYVSSSHVKWNQLVGDFRSCVEA